MQLGQSFTDNQLEEYRVLTPMYTEVTVVFIQRFQCCDIRSSWYNLVHPLDGLHHFVSLLLSEDRGSFMLGDLL